MSSTIRSQLASLQGMKWDESSAIKGHMKQLEPDRKLEDCHIDAVSV
jgi:hypothetical protein